ncbi:ETEC_3214 domain-containing protein [Vibrio porteresiae]|uniref:Uncharacterized protein n=1 Tax=Vibrio porteresiae DSM 19223 TaxID=1123496 RepID=A0ABZ0QFM5_9VIBR|nr:ETEC_3214 domain-containing protein [Vibrio porteresiae]WPC74313.1 hypothetical protein R8Z52_03345 [Vibrio porteresiae DSM 19223]
MTIETTDQESTPEQSSGLIAFLQKKLGPLIALLSLIVIALANFNDSSDALEKIYDFGLSQFTDIPSQQKLDKIYIRSSANVLEETFGAPVYIKHSYSGDVIKYYRDDKFILSAITKDDAIMAYLVFPSEGFLPNTAQHAGGADLLTTTFSQQESVQDFRSTMSRMVSYYLEENATGEFSNLYSSVAGYSEFDTPLDDTHRTLLNRLSDDQTFGRDSEKDVQAVRAGFKPNFFGYSALQGIGPLEDAILTKSEYRLITQ